MREEEKDNKKVQNLTNREGGTDLTPNIISTELSDQEGITES